MKRLLAKKGISFRVIASKPVPRLRIGDTVWAKGQQGRITGTFVHDGKRVYLTDAFGMVYEDEVIFQ